MLAWFAHRHCVSNDLRQLQRAGDGLLTTRRNDAVCDAPGETFFSVLADDASNLVLGHSRQPLCSGNAALIVHTHVEWTVLHEAEASRGVVELWR